MHETGSLPVILIGGSVRAAAFSALRAGLTPWCIDLFADADLRAVAPVQRCELADYPSRMLEMLADAPSGPVIYTGGLENYPRVIERIAEQRPLWGNDAAALRKCRDPFFVARLYGDWKLNHPMAARMIARSASEGFLRKPRRGAGGANIAPAASGDPAAPGFYFQEFIPGPACSAVFCAFADRVELLGVTEQLIGEPWLNAKPFSYCGSIGPIQTSAEYSNALLRIGEALQAGCGLRGLFGVDFIQNDGEPWPIEVNPRYTASIEVLEHACDLRALAWHQAAFDPLPASSPQRKQGKAPSLACAAGSRRCVGKAILFASRPLVVPRELPWPMMGDPFALPEIGDVPNPGEIIEKGWPILTLFAAAASPSACRENLRARAREIEAALIGDIEQPCRTARRP